MTGAIETFLKSEVSITFKRAFYATIYFACKKDYKYISNLSASLSLVYSAYFFQDLTKRSTDPSILFFSIVPPLSLWISTIALDLFNVKRDHSISKTVKFVDKAFGPSIQAINLIASLVLIYRGAPIAGWGGANLAISIATVGLEAIKV